MYLALTLLALSAAPAAAPATALDSIQIREWKVPWEKTP